MRDNYRYLHGNRRLTVSTQHLLLRSQQFFSSVTGELIDDIVRCLYPKCEKMPKRHGSVYVGLVARPEVRPFMNICITSKFIIIIIIVRLLERQIQHATEAHWTTAISSVRVIVSCHNVIMNN